MLNLTVDGEVIVCCPVHQGQLAPILLNPFLSFLALHQVLSLLLRMFIVGGAFALTDYQYFLSALTIIILLHGLFVGKSPLAILLLFEPLHEHVAHLFPLYFHV